MENKKFLSFVLIFIGFILVSSSSFNITGAVISGSGGILEWAGSIIGLIFIIGGLIVLMSYSLDEIIYEARDIRGNREFRIADPESLFTNEGSLGMEQFFKEINSIKEDPELINIVKSSYISPLLRVADEGEGRKSQLAKKCLNLLGMEYIEDDEYGGNPEKKEVMDAFRDYSGGNLNRDQKEILKRYNLGYIKNHPHSKIVDSKGNLVASVINSGSDKRNGLNLASKIAKFITQDKN